MRPLSVAPTRTRLICTLLAMSMAAACGDSPSGLADANLAASVTGAGVDPSAICSPLVTVPFYADNGAALVGTVQVGNDDSMLYVTLTTQSGWTMNRSHVFAGESPAGIPTSKAGNAVPGKFQLKQNHGTSTTSYTYGIPLSTLDTGAPVVLAVHADVLLGDRREGAWGDGLDGQAISAGGSWGTYFEYTVGSCASELITVIDGGLIVYQNLQFTVPSGSVPSDVIITAVPIDVNDLSPSSPAVSADGTTDAAHSLNFDAVLRIAGTGWDMGPDGLTFNTPARITLAYDETRLPPGVSEAQLKIFIINGIFDELPSTVDAVNNTVSADVNHFTSFFIGATLPGTDHDVTRFAELADPVKLGNQAEYSTDIMNLGPDAASGAVVTYVAFGDVALTQIVPTCTEIQNPIFGDVAVSCPVNRAIPSGGTEGAPSFLVEPQSVGNITVWASVSPVVGESDPDFSNNRLENTTTIEPAVVVDLAVSRFVELADPVKLGSQAEYSTDVRNLGPDAASGAIVTYAAFGDVALTQIVPTCTEIQNPIFGNVAVSCPVNRAIPSGGTEGAPSFLVEPQSAGTITVWATVSPVSGETDTNSSNNRLENTTTTNPASAFAGMVAFVSDRDGSRDLYVKNLATGAITQLTDDAATEANPVWSPDGTRIAYDKTTNSLGTGSDIFVINANGTSETRLTSNLDSFHPTWSPDGTELAYQDRSDGDWEIMVLNVASPSTRRKLTDNTGQDLEPDWNGGSILFRRTNLVSGSTINTMDASDGGNVVEVVALGALNAPAFSPDGTRIVYERRAGTAWSIEVLTLGGGAVVVESDGVRNTGPAFSPDGTHVIFAKNPDLASQVYNLWVTAADGSTTSQSVETSAGNDLHPSWR